MPTENASIVFSPSARAQQERHGSRVGYAKMEQTRGFADSITPDLAAFIAERDSMYLGTVSADGWPYIQHRGGAKGFIKVVDDRTLAFADFAGNRQYISMGNLDDNDRAFMFLMDYPTRRRIKVWGRAKFVEDDAALLAQLTDADYAGRVERALVFTVEAWDVNCKQHIQPRFDESQVAEVVEPLRDRIAELEAQLASYETGNGAACSRLRSGAAGLPSVRTEAGVYSAATRTVGPGERTPIEGHSDE